ncbi:uncharacterized protein TNCV_3131621 [Trichonephila clavipes]|nr:uncharacterized protein TNCV_3131621 [Trichonephila clavipes]
MMNFVGLDLTSADRGFRRSSIPYEEFKDEPGSTSDEVISEPMITYDCAYCEYRSPTQKGLRCHRITVHRIGVEVSGCLDHEFGHISRCLNTIKCTFIAVLQWLFGLKV